MTQCLDILSIPDQTESINAFLKLICEFYHSKFAFICEFDSNNTTLTSKYFWSSTNGDVSIPLDQQDTVSMDSFLHWLKNDKNKDIINIDSSEKSGDVDTTGREILDKYKISNITLNKLWDKDGSLLGIVGMSNRDEPIYDDRLIKAVSHFVVERFNEASTKKALESLNEIDLLTGFFNRKKYGEKLASLFRSRPKSLGVLFINLNGLRKTNEYFGFKVGDVQIKKTTALLRDYKDSVFHLMTLGVPTLILLPCLRLRLTK